MEPCSEGMEKLRQSKPQAITSCESPNSDKSFEEDGETVDDIEYTVNEDSSENFSDECDPDAIHEPDILITELEHPNKSEPVKRTNLTVSMEELSQISGVKLSTKGFLVQLEKGLTCLICAAKLSSRSCLYRHLQTHVPRSKFTCHICHRTLASKACLKQHLNLHSDLFKCRVCGKACVSNTDLNKHMEGHLTEKRFSCEVCLKSFLTRAVLTSHRFLHTDKFKCDICDRRCLSKFALKTHKQIHFPHKYYPCPICHKSFSSSNVLKLHSNMHSDRYKCEVCNQKCITGFALQEHMSVHSKEKSFVCAECGQTFSNRSNLRVHSIRHTDRYKCPNCNKRHLSKTHLIKHLPKCQASMKADGEESDDNS